MMQPAPLGTARRLNRNDSADTAVPRTEVRTLPGLALTALALIAAALAATAAGHGWADGALFATVAAVAFLGAGITLLVTEHGRAVRPGPRDE